MGYRFNEGDRIRLAEDVGQELPFLRKGATGVIQKHIRGHAQGPAYFLQMDPVDFWRGENLDYWMATEDQVEAEDA